MGMLYEYSWFGNEGAAARASADAIAEFDRQLTCKADLLASCDVDRMPRLMAKIRQDIDWLLDARNYTTHHATRFWGGGYVKPVAPSSSYGNGHSV